MSKQRKPNRREVLAAAGAAVIGGAAFASGTATIDDQRPAIQTAARHDVLDEVDVLVVGGGPAGIGAALGAAKGR